MELLRGEVREKCESMDVPLLGFASVSAWDQEKYAYIPEDQRPEALLPGARSAIVMGIPVSLPVVLSAPSIWYAELYRTVNSLLDQSAYRLAMFLEAKGHRSAFVPRDGYPGLNYLKEGGEVMFSHRHAAVMAGLGSFGLSNVVLTPQYGPRVRFVTVLTQADLGGAEESEELCAKCGLCVRRCPVGAVADLPYPDGLTDKQACITRSGELRAEGRAPCGICIAVCPIGEDRHGKR